MPWFIISAVALVGAWYVLKDAPGGYVQRHTPNSFRFKPWDLA